MNAMNPPMDGFRQREVRDIEPHEGHLQPLQGERTVEVDPIPYFGICRQQTRRSRKLMPSWWAEINNATVHAPTFAVTSGDTLWQLDHETGLPYRSAGYSNAFQAVGGDRFRFITPSSPPRSRIGRAVLLGNRVSTSYFHWVFEILPKLLLLEQADQLGDAPLLIDSRLGASARAMLSLIVGPNRPLIELEPGQSVAVDRLVVASSCAHLPDDPRLEPERVVIDPAMVQALAARLRPVTEPQDRTPLLWVSRRRYAEVHKQARYIARDIENSAEIETQIDKAGGRIIAPEYLTLEEQRREFAAADRVAMVAGSAGVNLLFCRPGVPVLLLSQDKHVNPGLFLPIVRALGLPVAWLFGPGVRSEAPPPHWNFLIDPLNMRRSIGWLCGDAEVPDGMLPLD